MAASKQSAKAAEPTEPESESVPVSDEELSAARVELVTTHNVAAGINAKGEPVDHVESPFDHVIEVHN